MHREEQSKANLPGGPPRSHDLPEEEVEDVAIQLSVPCRPLLERQ
jgi:hypothetical protein